MEAQQLAGSDVSENTARFVDQGGVEGIRDVSAGRPIRLFVDADDPRRGRQGRHREAAARYGLGVFEIALPFKGDAFRVVFSVQFAERSRSFMRSRRNRRRVSRLRNAKSI